ARGRGRDRARSLRLLQPVLEDVRVEPVALAATVAGTDLLRLELDEVERLLRQTVAAVGTGLGVLERGVDAFDPSGLPLQVTGRAVVPLHRPCRDAHPLAGAI